MSEEKTKTTKFRNSVVLVGYLKETTLVEKVSQGGRHFITGNITVAVSEFDTHRVRFLVFQDNSAEMYEKLTKFLPNNTVSVASYLKSTPTANFNTAASMAAKIWVVASLREFASRDGERVKTMPVLDGFNIGKCDPDKTFDPKSDFEVDAYIESMEDEADENGNATGRLLVSALIPGYKGIMYRVPMVAQVEMNTAKYMKNVYNVGDTALLKGKLLAMKVTLQKDEGAESEFFGEVEEQQYTTRFVREIVIKGGSKKPIPQGAEGSISKESVKEGLVLRETEMDKNGQHKGTKEAAPAEDPAPAKTTPTQTQTAPGFDDDCDF